MALVLVLAGPVLRSRDNERGTERALADIPPGVSVACFADRPTFVVRRNDDIDVFLTNIHHIAGENGVWWCPGEGVVAAPTHGEVFDLEGQVVGGPASAGLDRLPTRVAGKRLVIDPTHSLPGPPRPAVTPLSEGSVFRGGAFCPHALRSSGEPPADDPWGRLIETLWP